ncbi:MAG: hypothetical protein WC805_01185 [Patescibacteria group bacterium]|jgi:mevalonate kinase
MNSKAIQQILPTVYGEFFAKCSLVASAPGDFFWGGEHCILSGGIGITQHIPLRSYAGLRPADKPGFYLKSFRHHLPRKNEFSEINPQSYDFSEMTKLLYQEAIKISPQGTFVGYEIYGLSEIPMSCGLNTVGAFSVALATVFFMALKQLTSEDILEWSQITTSQLSKNTRFNQMFRLAWKINSIIHGKTYPAIRTFSPAARTALPIFCCSPKTTDQNNVTNDINQLSYWGGDLSEIITKQHTLNWPIDILLINSGENRSTGLTSNTTGEVRYSLDAVAQEIQQHLESVVNDKRHNFLHNISIKDFLWFNYLNALSTVAIEILNSLHHVFNLYSEESIRNLSRAVRKHNYSLRLLTLTTPRIQELSIAIRDYTQTFCSMKAGIKLTGGGQGGDLLVVTPHDDLRDKLPGLMDRLKQLDPNKSVAIDYISWEDGLETDGVRLEQDFDQKIYSPWISSSSYKLHRLDRQSQLQKTLISETEYRTIKQTASILLDKIEKRIYICGQKLTSKELKSASATIEIIEFLLPRAGQEVKNIHLPESIYAADRNEFQSKIMIPLEKICKNCPNPIADLLEIKGGITDFSVKLQPNEEINILEKIN